MSSGSQHQKATVALAVVFLYLDAPSWYTLGVLSGLLITPDHDIIENKHGNVTLSTVRSVPIIGEALSSAWRWYWYPYGKLISHRSLISHAPAISTLIRIVYLLWWFWFIPDSRIYNEWVIGLMASDLLHIAMDLLSTWYKKRM